ncbi:hypothetical protein SAMN05421770_10131 [Granulicella rosea]|uniref:Carboxypeptidase regulatory-like domain-containing protein n=1 Tax=Granulicella rosea TaxID=474952 RepID=A0A239CQP6_9BACT|nr:hypothetical protein [Granulicella rosea]SNS21824.1 hypothetical protein SAMN05421770_10131 [Granulicella rosea]
MKRLAIGVFAGLSVLAGITGCKPDAAVQKAEVLGRGSKDPGPAPVVPSQSTPDSAPVAALDPATLGSASGVVLFHGKAPAPVLIDTSMDPACGMGPAKGPVHSEQIVVSGDKLANVFVYVKSGPPQIASAPRPTTPVVLDQQGCKYVPHVIGVVHGGYVEFHNSDITMHNIHTMPTVVGNETIDVSQGPKGTPKVKQMQLSELMVPVRCNNHPWMNAYINIAPTPFFAVTDATGKFEIKGLPAGDYVLAAVQEKLGEQDLNITVPAQGTAKADFAFAAK